MSERCETCAGDGMYCVWDDELDDEREYQCEDCGGTGESGDAGKGGEGCG